MVPIFQVCKSRLREVRLTSQILQLGGDMAKFEPIHT